MTQKAKIRVAEIAMTRAEGPLNDPSVGRRLVFQTFAEARLRLRVWQSALDRDPAYDRGSYDKIDCKVRWADGEDYAMRFDLSQARHQPRPCLKHEILREIRFWIGDHRPPHFPSEKAYHDFIEGQASEAYRAALREFLNTHDLEDAE